MPAYFNPHSLRFLRGLASNNNKAWFDQHRSDYETHVREPFLRLVGDLQPALATISPHYRAEPRKVGGSLYRIHRDVRYRRDKSPYKPWQGMRLFHERRREVPCPAFYVQLQPGSSFVGAGLWHPDYPVQRQVRQFIFDNPASWGEALRAATRDGLFVLSRDDALVRPPRGYPPEFELIEDLKLRSWVLSRALTDQQMTGDDLLPLLEDSLARLAPFVDYLCAALDLDF